MAVQANDLRIGNFIHYKKDGWNLKVDHFSQATAYATNNESMVSGSLTLFDPIPLTSDILDKCGFIKTLFNEKEQWFGPEIIRHNPYSTFQIAILRTDFLGFYYSNELNNVLLPYLHQLQNLFWCLCGEELKVNL